MAYVSITHNKQQIFNQVALAMELEIAQHKALIKVPPSNSPELHQTFMAAMWKGKEHLLDTTPDEWIVRHSRNRMDIQTPYGEHQVQVTDCGQLAFPPTATTSYVEINYTDIDAPWMPDLLVAIEKIQAVRQRYNVIDSQLKSYLGSCKSLNEAVKYYPDLIHLVPDDLKRRMEETNGKTPPKKLSPAEKVLQGVDTAQITAVAITLKLGGNGS